MPTGTSLFRGTIAVSSVSPNLRANLTWLPFCRITTNPAASNRRFTSGKGNGLSRPNLYLNHANFGKASCVRRLEMQLQCFS